MTGSPQVSVVIAVLNAATELEATLTSLESQDRAALEEIEIVVVDGGSSDGTVGVAERSSLPLTVVSETDDGIYDAMNKGAERANGRWLHFLNAGDTFADSGSLAVVLRGLRHADASRATWFIGGARYIGGELEGVRIANLPHVWYRHALGLQPHCHQATWFRADLFVALGGYDLDSDFVADFDLIMRWGLTSKPETDETTVIHYLSGGLSERRGARIPSLIRAVRIRRMQLDPVPVPVERVFVFATRGVTKLSRLYAARRPAALSADPDPHSDGKPAAGQA